LRPAGSSEGGLSERLGVWFCVPARRLSLVVVLRGKKSTPHRGRNSHGCADEQHATAVACHEENLRPGRASRKVSGVGKVHERRSGSEASLCRVERDWSYPHRMMRAVELGPTVLGFLFIAAAAVLLLIDTGHLSRRLPMQVPPRGFALLPLGLGILLLLLGFAFSS
jgi:hypothetical protein